MDFASGLVIIQIISVLAGIFVSGLLASVRRFGPASWMIALYLVPAGLASVAITAAPQVFGCSLDLAARIFMALLLLAAPGGALVSHTLDREDYWQYIGKRWFSLTAICLAALILTLALFHAPEIQSDAGMIRPGDIILGPAGFAAALYLLIISVIVLANIEQILRSSPEHVRWEIKFLLLGMGASWGGTIYICSKVLLYPPKVALISTRSVEIFAPLFLISCCLILVSWRRSSGRSRVIVSHGFIFSSITLLAVGLYLILSSLAAKWAGQWAASGFPGEALVYFMAILALAIILLWTDLRHRLKMWIRENLLSGSYDYRHYWLEAGERVRFIDRPEEAAASLADIVQHSLGAIDISIWMRLRNPNRLKLLAARGRIEQKLPLEITGISERLWDVNDPIRVKELEPGPKNSPILDFAEQLKASVFVPLQSSRSLAGLLSVGPDRSGRPYGWEAFQFLGVLGKHAAAELHKADLFSTMVQAKETEAFRVFSTFLLHDLKNFASTLSLIARNAEKHQANPQFQQDAFRSVFETAEKMKRLCNNLHMFSSTLAANKRLGDLNIVVRETVDILSIEPEGRVQFELGRLQPLSLDPDEISRVIQNLIQNAREAISDTGSITVRTSQKDGFVELTVEDDGHGMKRDFVERELFQPFHTTKSAGLGIGLFQCKKIIEAHGGTIGVETEEGKGTKVWIHLPCGLPSVSSDATDQSSSYAESSRPST